MILQLAWHVNVSTMAAAVAKDDSRVNSSSRNFVDIALPA